MSLGDKSFKKLRKKISKKKIKTPEDYERLEKEVIGKFYEKAEESEIARVKLTAGSAKNIYLEVPRVAKTMTSRLKISMFDFLGIDIQKTRILDLYAGAGAFGFEALSRGASEATFIDSSKYAVHALENNAQKTGFVLESTIIKQRVEEFIEENLDEKSMIFDVIFLDPPYKLFNTKHLDKMHSIIKRSRLYLPYFRGEKKQFKGLIIVKHPTKYPIDDLKFDDLRLVEKKKFGKNTVSFFIVSI